MANPEKQGVVTSLPVKRLVSEEGDNPAGLTDKQMAARAKWLHDWENGGRDAHIAAVKAESQGKVEMPDCS